MPVAIGAWVCPVSCVAIRTRTASAGSLGFDVGVSVLFTATFFTAGFLAFGLVGAFLLVGFFVVINC